MSPRHWLARRLQRKGVLDWPSYYAERASECQQTALSSFYSAGVVAPDTPIAEVPFAALDLETTGLNPQRNNIVSIGVVPFTMQRVQLRAGRHWVVKPDAGLTDESVRFHHLTHADVAEAPPLRAVLNEVLAALQGRVVVCHYLPIERQFLRYATRQCWQEEWVFPIVDTMQIERQRLRHSGASLMARWRRQEVTSLRLNDCRRRYGLPAYTAHHAFTDALATAELLQAQWQRARIAEKTVGEWWS